MQEALIFDIKRYAINDGPGIRITIFMKGCPLSCHWCHNPESQKNTIQRMYTQSKCISCGECVKACYSNAINLTNNGIITDKNKCTVCGKCAKVCPTKAIEMSGEYKSIDKLLAIIEKERVFFEQSGGGVTFSGGDPLMYSEHLIKLLKACGDKNIHRVVDTTGYTKTKTLLEVAKNAEYFLFDLKMMDSEKHKKYTGVKNELILKNLKALSQTGAEINIRIPLIANVNDDNENILATAEFISALAGKKKQINILPYHNIASKKYEKLGVTYHDKEMKEPSLARQEEIIKTFELFGLKAIIGG